jgi:hypothetical protein
VSPTFVVICDKAGGRDEVFSLEQGYWSKGGGFADLLRLHRWKTMDLGPRQHEDIPRSTCHIDMCLCVQQACSSTHKASLAMVFSWIWKWWRLDVFSIVHLGGAGVGRRLLASVVAEIL